MLVYKNKDILDKSHTLKHIVVDYLNNKGIPLTTFQIKECFISKSENHARLIVSNLLEDGVILKIDSARYCLLSHLNPFDVNNIKNEIKMIIENTNKIILGSYFKDNIEKKHCFVFSRFLYSSLARIVCIENGYPWRRHACSRDSMGEDFSLESYFHNVFNNCKDNSFDEFRKIALEGIEIEESDLKSMFYKFINNSIKKAA